MTLRGLERICVAGVTVALPADLELPDPGLLEEHLRPFAAAGGGAAEVLVEPLAGPPPAEPLPPDTFRVDVNRVEGGDLSLVNVKPFWLTETADGIRVRGRLTDSRQVIAGIHLGLAHRLPQRGALLLHAAAVRAAGVAFVFAGASEAGKSTAASRFDGGELLADERVAVCAAPGEGGGAAARGASGWLAHAVPMNGGKYPPVASVAVPLGLLVVLRKDEPLSTTVLSPAAAVARLAPAVMHHYYDRAKAGRVLEALARLASAVPVVELSYKLGESFAGTLLARARAAAEARAAGGG